MNYKIKFINQYNDICNSEIIDGFFSAKTNSLFFVSQAEANRMRKKLVMLKAEKKGQSVDMEDVPIFETEYAEKNRMSFTSVSKDKNEKLDESNISNFEKVMPIPLIFGGKETNIHDGSNVQSDVKGGENDNGNSEDEKKSYTTGKTEEEVNFLENNPDIDNRVDMGRRCIYFLEFYKFIKKKTSKELMKLLHLMVGRALRMIHKTQDLFSNDDDDENNDDDDDDENNDDNEISKINKSDNNGVSRKSSGIGGNNSKKQIKTGFSMKNLQISKINNDDLLTYSKMKKLKNLFDVIYCEVIKKLIYTFVNNLYFGVKSKRFMNENEFRLFYDDTLLFLREVIYFTPDLQRLIHKLCGKFEIDYKLAESFINFPLIDKQMYGVGEVVSEKFVYYYFDRILTEKIVEMDDFREFNISELFSEFSEKSKVIITTEKVFFQKIINQIIDLIVYKFLVVVSNSEKVPKNQFVEELKKKVEQLKTWIKLKANELNIALGAGGVSIENAFQANRNDVFKIGGVRKSNIF